MLKLLDYFAMSDHEPFGHHRFARCLLSMQKLQKRRSNRSGPMQFGPPDWPAAANLTSHERGLGKWSFDDFDRALTEGVSLDGRPLRDPLTHVIPGTRAMTLTERKAIWTYLRSLTPLPTNP